MAEVAVTVAMTRMVYPSTSASVDGFVNTWLYVGDLDGNVTEGQLLDLFNTVGQVVSVRVCRDREKGVSLGYGFVNYINAQDANKAQELLNFTRINGKEIRIMFSNRDPSKRKSGIGNVFVKNLDPSIDNKSLYETFAVFGTVLTCKVAVYNNGGSKGYGFVQFDREEDAQTAIRTLNRKLMNDQRVYVGPFIRQEERNNTNVYEIIREANLYMKNLDESITDDMLEELFSEFGTIKSCKVMVDPNGESKGFGFVAFSNPNDAKKAMDEMKGKMVGRKPLYITIAQPKAERMALLQAHFGPAGVHHGAPNLAPQPPYLGQGGPGLLPPPGYGIMTGLSPSNFLMIPYVPLRRGRAENHSGPIRPGSPQAMSRQPLPDGPNQLFRRIFGGQIVADDNRMVEALKDNDVFRVPSDIASSSSQVDLQLSGPIDHRGKFASVLAFATPQNQRWILDEHLFPLVAQIERENATKITAMLLDSMDLTEIIHLIESPEVLKKKVAEVMEMIVSNVEF